MKARLCFVIGSSLLLVNLYGLFVSLRNPAIYHDRDNGFNEDITLSQEQFYAAANKVFRRRREYLEHVNYTVSKAIAHYWYDQGVEKYNLRVPFYDNFILYLASYIAPEYFQKYEFLDYHRALERGVGLCSQAAIVLAEFLRDKGMTAKIVGLTGHVLVTAPVDEQEEEWWVFDPDYGVTLPFSLDIIEKNTAIIEPYYAKGGYSEAIIAGLKIAFGPKGNTIKSGNGIEGYGLKWYYLEKSVYLLKWLLPVALILFGLMKGLALRWPTRRSLPQVVPN